MALIALFGLLLPQFGWSSSYLGYYHVIYWPLPVIPTWWILWHLFDHEFNFLLPLYMQEFGIPIATFPMKHGFLTNLYTGLSYGFTLLLCYLLLTQRRYRAICSSYFAYLLIMG